jgi:hypothetical protein
MSASLENLFGYIPLSQKILQPTLGVPFPKGLLPLVGPDVENKDAISDTVIMPVFAGSRKAARTTSYGSAHTGISQEDFNTKPIKMLSVREFWDAPADLFARLRQPASYNPDVFATAYIDQMTANSRARIDNLKTGCILSMLQTGKIWLGTTGNLLASSSGAAITIDAGVPAGHQSQLNWDGNGDIIGTLWSNAAAPVFKQIQDIQNAGLIETGYPITTAYYGRNIPQYLSTNTSVGSLQQTAPYYDAFKMGAVPQGFLGIDNWIPIPTAFWQNEAGTNVVLDYSKTVVFTPDVNRNWWQMGVGQSLMPSGIIGATYSDASAATAGVNLHRGMYQWAVLNGDPVTIRSFFGDVFLPMIVNGKAVFQATVA